MRCSKNILTIFWCVFFASLLGAPTAIAADHTRAAAPKISRGEETVAATTTTAADRYGDLPLSFEANQGQVADGQIDGQIEDRKIEDRKIDGAVQFLSRGSGYSFFLTKTGAVLTLSRDPQAGAVLRMQLLGANSNPRIQGQNELPGKSNYFFGRDSSRWRTGISTFSQVRYESVYPGISLVYYGNQRQLEYDFVIAPGADPRQIRLSIAGAEKLNVDAQGNLILRNAAGEVQLLAPRIYQQIGGEKKEIAGQWTLAANHIASFRLGKYDRAQPLVIDPVLQYSSFLGGSQKNAVNRIALDAAGNAYVAGYTASGDFPAAPTPQANTFGPGTPLRGAFVAKIDPTGTNLLYSTYLSGSSDDEATGLAVDNSGNVYLSGNTRSPDFPTRNALQSACPTHNQAGTCASAFLTKISPTGDSLMFSTYLGGSGGESSRGLTIDSTGSIYIAGVTSSQDFPVTAGAAQTKCSGSCQQNAFVAKFAPSGETLDFATYVGGSAIDNTADLAVDSSGNVYLTGKTTSPDFPLATPYLKSCSPDATNPAACVATAFVTKIKADGSAFLYSTYLGGSLGSQASAIAVDALGSAYITGSTQSSDFPVFNAFQKSCGLDPASGKCSVDAFLTKFAPSGKALVYSTYLGGAGDDQASAIAVDATGNAHVVGTTESADFPTMASLQLHLKGSSDAFVARFSATGSALTFSTYHGGAATESGNSIALDAKGNVYLAGETSSADFPTYHPFQSSCAGACTSAFVTKMSLPPAPTLPPTIQKTFVPTSVELNVPASTSTLTLTITNPASNAVALTGVGVSDTIPSGMSASGTVTNTCGGTAALATGPPQVLSLAGGSIAISGSCTVSVTVAGTTAGAIVNTTGNVTSTEGGTGTDATATLAVVGPPSLNKAFGAASVPLHGTTTLSFTITNPATNTVALTGVGFSDTLPTGLTVATSSTPNVCGAGTLTTTAGTGVITLSGGTVAAGNPGTCALPSITVTGAAAGDYTNTVSGAGAITSTNGGTGTASNTAALTVGSPASILKTFTIATVPLNGSTTLNFGIQNANATLKLTGLAFTDSLPAGLVVAQTPALTNTCGGTATATAGATSVSLSGGTLNPTSGCNVSVSVTGTTAGAKNNSVTISSTEGGAGNTSMATLTVVAPPTITKAFSNTVKLNIPASTAVMTLTITNPSSTVGLTGVAVSDTLPAGMALATTTGIATTCTAGTATATGGVVALTGATIAASSSCTVTANVVGTAAGSIANTTGAVTSTNGGTGLTATGNLIVLGPPVLAEVFNPTSIPLGSTSALTFTLSNPSGNTVAQTGVTFTDTLPTGLTVATATAPNVCGTGTLTTTAATGVITLTGGTVAAGTGGNPGRCSLSVTVTGAAAGSYSNLVDGTNGTVLISSTNGGTGVAPTSPATLIVAAPPTIAKAFAPTTITLGASSTLSFALSNPATNTVALTGVTFSDTLPAGLSVSAGATLTNTCGGTFSASGAAISLSGGTVPVGTGGNPGACALSVVVTGIQGGLNLSNTIGVITSNNGGSGTASNTATITVQDYLFTAVESIPTLIQGSTTLMAANVTVTPEFTYAGTVSSAGCTPAGFTCIFGSIASGSSPVSIAVGASTPVGLYSNANGVLFGATDSSTPPITHNAGPFTFSVQCALTLGQTVPTLIPVAGANSVSYQVAIGVTETAGGSACPYGNYLGQPVVGGIAISDASISSGNNGAATSIVSGQQNGALAAPSTSNPLTFGIDTPSSSGGKSVVTVPYFDATQTGNQAMPAMAVGLEPEPAAQLAVNGSVIMIPVTEAAAGTLTVASMTVGGACVAANLNGQLDSTNNNFGISCTAAVSGNNIQLTLNVAQAAAARQNRSGRALLYALAFGLPGMVFFSVGAAAFAPKPRKRGFRRLTCILGIFLVLSLLVLLPACGGGFKFHFTNAATFTLTGMAYVTDSNNNIIGVDVFTVPLTAD